MTSTLSAVNDIAQARPVALPPPRSQASLNRLAAMVECAADALIGISLAGEITVWNGEAETIFGARADEMIGRCYDSIVPDELADEAADLLRRLTAGESIAAAETIRLHRSGARIDVSLSAAPLKEADGRVVGGVLVLRDVSASRKKFALSHLRHQALDEVCEGVLFTDLRQPDNPIVYVNPAFEKLTGYKAGELIGKNWRLLQGPGTDRAAVLELQEAVEQRRACTVELLNYRADGSTFWNSVSVAPLHDEHGRIVQLESIRK